MKQLVPGPKPPVAPVEDPVMTYPEDVARLVGVATVAGYRIYPYDAGEIWRLYSESMCASWLSPGGWSDTEIFEAMTRCGIAIDVPVSRPTPPKGYATWLDYAVDCMDTRSVEIESILDEDSGAAGPSRDDMRQAVKAELEELRGRAGGQANEHRLSHLLMQCQNQQPTAGRRVANLGGAEQSRNEPSRRSDTDPE